jgi:hypothetical protein
MVIKIKLIIQRDKSKVLILDLKCKYIKALQGLTSGEIALPPVAPEVIHIQSFL